MQSVSNGYTVIEVLIFLAVSAMIFVSAVTLIGGHQSQAQFSTVLRDVNSKMQDWINDVSTGVPTGAVGQYWCHLTGPSVKIDSGSAPTPNQNNPDCIFLGKAIQFSTDPSQSSQIFAYPVFGQRLLGGSLVTNMRDANPTPAIGNPSGGASSGSADDLWEEYDLPGDIKVTKLENSAGVSTSDRLFGFYSSFNTEQNTSSNGSVDIKAYRYPLGDVAPRSLELFNCVNNNVPCPLPGGSTDPSPLSKIIICLSNTKDSGYVTLNSINGIGVSTQMDFGTCP